MTIVFLYTIYSMEYYWLNYTNKQTNKWNETKTMSKLVHERIWYIITARKLCFKFIYERIHCQNWVLAEIQWKVDSLVGLKLSVNHHFNEKVSNFLKLIFDRISTKNVYVHVSTEKLSFLGKALGTFLKSFIINMLASRFYSPFIKFCIQTWN